MSKKKTLIFGTGSIAKGILPLVHSEYEIIAFIDNDKSKWGSEFENYPIYSPDKILEIDYDVIIIATVAGLEPVSEQLLSLGVKKEKIITIGLHPLS